MKHKLFIMACMLISAMSILFAACVSPDLQEQGESTDITEQDESVPASIEEPPDIAEQAEQIETEIIEMGIDVRQVTISEGEVVISYVYPPSQHTDDAFYDWISIGTAVILYTESEYKDICIVPEIKGVPVYQVSIDSRDLALYLDGRIGPETLLLNMNYTW